MAERRYPSDAAFTPSVKAVQARKGSRHAYARMESAAGWETAITSDLAAFIGAQVSVFLATASASGQPYIQHRGGPPGFLRVLDGNTIGFADFDGNRQYITTGNLQENPRAHLFLMDYANRQRIKLWGTARVVDDDPALVQRLMPAHYPARAGQAILFHVDAWDANCPRHIPQLLDGEQMAAELRERDRRIAELEREIARLRQ